MIGAVCGRYVIAFDPETLAVGFSALRVPAFPRRWNVAPQSTVPVVHDTPEGERTVTLMRWGLVPHWARDDSIGARLNNARTDGIFDKPSFRQAVRRRRCLLPASGFYEWQTRAAPAVHGRRPPRPIKQPWYLSSPDGEPLALAALFEAWRPDTQSAWQLTCCVITTDANALMAPIHDRMPVLIARRDWPRWLDRGAREPADIAPLLQAPPRQALQAWPVARAVNQAAVEGPALIEPVDPATLDGVPAGDTVAAPPASG